MDITALVASRLMRMRAMAGEEMRPLTGEVEVDESYLGARRVRGKVGMWCERQNSVLGLHKRENRGFVSVVENCSRRELITILKGHILEKSDVYPDGWKACDGLVASGYKHHRVYHHQNEFARGRNHVNGMESFWSYPKHRIMKLRGIRKNKFFLHLKEGEFRENHNTDNIYSILLSNCRNKPL